MASFAILRATNAVRSVAFLTPSPTQCVAPPEAVYLPGAQCRNYFAVRTLCRSAKRKVCHAQRHLSGRFGGGDHACAEHVGAALGPRRWNMAVMAADTVTDKPGYVSWGAAITGALFASALSFVLLTFGSAVGLSMVSPWTSTASSAKWAGALAVFWIVAQQIGSFLAGGYIAGRLRSRWAEAKPDEIEFRDGIHGALVWAIGTIIGAMLAASVASSVVSTATSAVGQAAGAAASQSDLLSYQVDVLFRPGAQPAGGATPPSDPNVIKSEVLRIFANAATAGGLSP